MMQLRISQMDPHMARTDQNGTLIDRNPHIACKRDSHLACITMYTVSELNYIAVCGD